MMNFDSQNRQSSAQPSLPVIADHQSRTADLRIDGGRRSAAGRRPPAQKYRSILLCLLILAAAAVGAYHWADVLQHSMFIYQSPLSVARIPPGEPMPSQTRRVVVVIIGGLNYDTAYSAAMPNLGTILDAGASAPMIGRPPTYSPSAWTTLMTGVWPDLNNAPIGEIAAADMRSIVLDHLFAAASDAGLRTAFVGFEGWERLLMSGAPDASFYTSKEDAIADGQIAETALAYIADPQYNLILIHFSQVDAAGRTKGAASAVYFGAARQVDRHLRQIARLVDLSESVLIVTSDHGRLENGQLGGGERDLTQLPFVMIGQKVVLGDYSPVRQIDMAPTIAALLGTRLPAAAQGRPLYEMIHLDEEALTSGQLLLAEQKVTLGDAYLTAMGGNRLHQATHQDLAGARQSLLDGNRSGAFQLAELVIEEVSAEMAAAKMARIAGERLPRLGVAVVGLLLPLIIIWTWRIPNLLVTVIGGGIAVAIYYGLYRLGGYTFSLSAVDDAVVFVASLARYAGIGVVAGGLLVMVALLYQDERRWSAAVAAGYRYGLFAAYLSTLPALFGYWQHGAIVRWYLPELSQILLHFIALVQVIVVASLAIPLPWLIALVTWGVGRWRTYAEAHRQAWDPMARIRRR